MNSKLSYEKGDDPWAVLQDIDKRLLRIEQKLEFEPEKKVLSEILPEKENVSNEQAVEPGQGDESLEFEVGQTWFALIGITALAIGMAFILSLPFADFPAWMPSLAGYLISGVVFALAWLSRNSFEVISKYLRGSAMLLLFFATLRLCYFGEIPFLENDSAGATALFSLIVLFCMGLAWRRESNSLWILSATIACGSILVVGSSVFLAAMGGLTIALTVYVQLQKNWRNLVPVVFFLTTITYCIWAIGNPVAGGEIGIVKSSYPTVFLLPFSMALCSFAVLRRPDVDVEDANVQISVLIISVFGFSVYFLHHFLGYDNRLVLAQVFMMILLLGIALLFWSMTRGYFSTFVYAMTGYLSLSMALLKAFSFPEVFVALSVQSLVVIVTAVYFCSKLIILANFIIFIGIILGYVAVSQIEQGMSIGFGIVALVSARILNWQKKRLTLETEFMRNAYLTTAFIVLPYALFYLTPGAFVSVAWLGLSLFYYGLFLFFRNRKYRWMGHMTLLMTALYVTIIGTAQLESNHRIIAFLALGTIMVAVSLIFSVIRKKNNEKTED